jgi:hypothetical protein
LIDHHDASQTHSKLLDNDDDDGWHLVGTFKTTSADIKHYYVVPSKLNIDNYVSDLFILEGKYD